MRERKKEQGQAQEKGDNMDGIGERRDRDKMVRKERERSER